MTEIATNIRIFLSSTFTDLKDLRKTVASKLRDTLGTQLIVMESFGSDEAPPVISSVRKVRESDVFIGIYARRYGTVDPETGKSITQLELEEAERALSAGNIVAILLYLLDDASPWPQSCTDVGAPAVENLRRLKERAKQHTVSKFTGQDDLPFLVIRDVLGKVKHRLTSETPRLRKQELPEVRKIHHPIGMEFLTSADRENLYGRDEKIRELFERVETNPIALLLGNSGSGKTSLIHAGFFPRAISAAWIPVYTRPLGLPRADVAAAFFASVFEGTAPHGASLVPLLQQAVVATGGQRIVLVIDQFEDILTARQLEETDRLVADLNTIRRLNDPSIRVLISYRADLEARLGRFWQLISGSPHGLPRSYLAGIELSDAWKTIEAACDQLAIELDLTPEEKLRIGSDLASTSATYGEEGVYPPYIQMLVDHIWGKAREAARPYRFKDYSASGGMEGVTGGYLTRQLTYARDAGSNIRAVLVSLVRSYGVKAQKSIQEIASDVGVDEPRCESLLERLIDLRLVRHIKDQYEVAHDFLAREVSAKLVDSEEQEFKRFRELLASKSAAFDMTGGFLTVEELLGLFKHKERVLPSDDELKLILSSWARKWGPGLYWLLSAPPSRVCELIRLEEARDDLADEDRAMLALLRKSIIKSALEAKDWTLFRRYRLGFELAELLSSVTSNCPRSVIMWAIRSKNRIVREAASEAVAQMVKAGQEKWIAELGKSSSSLKRQVYESLVLREDIRLQKAISSHKPSRALREFSLLQAMARAKGASETRARLRDLTKFRPRARSLQFANGIMMQRRGGIPSMINRLRNMAGDRIAVLLSAVHGNLRDTEMTALLDAYSQWNQKELEHMEDKSRQRRALYEDKARALAMTVMRVADKRNLSALRDTFRKIELTPSAQFYVLGMLRVGSVSDVVGVINKVRDSEKEAQYWFQLGVSRVAERRMRELGRPIPRILLKVCRRKGFWEDPRSERSKFRREDFLPVRSQYNRALYVRLVAHAIIGAAQVSDQELLTRFARHEYRIIARAAAIRLVELVGDEGIRLLQSAIPAAVENGTEESLAYALHDAEIHKFGVARLW